MYVCVKKNLKLKSRISFISVNSRNCSQMSTSLREDTLAGPDQASSSFEFVNIRVQLSKSRQICKTSKFAQKLTNIGSKGFFINLLKKYSKESPAILQNQRIFGRKKLSGDCTRNFSSNVYVRFVL